MKRTPQLLALLGVLMVLSCTRMPTGPRTEVVVHGTITGPSGDPTRDTWVVFVPQETVLQDSVFDTYTQTGVDGTYSLPLLPGDYELRIHPTEHREWLGYSNLVRVSEDHDQFDYAFHGHHVTGRLLDPTGAVITYGSVEATIEAPHSSSAASGVEQGTFSLLLPSGTYSLTGQAGPRSGIPSRTFPGVSIASDTTLDLALTGFPVQGTVIGPDGAPMPGAQVEIWPGEVLTDDTGAYLIYADAGVHAIRCFPPYGHEEILFRTVARNVTGPTTVDFDLRGVTWSGTVRFEGTLDPADGYYVEALTLPPDNRYAYLRTGPDGEFHLILEANRTYDLHVHSPHADPPIYEARYRATADTTFEIVIPPDTPPPPSP